jgi:hypothetical protein
MEKKKSVDIYDVGFYKSLHGEAALKERQKGRLPIIDIAGYPFFVEVRLGLIRPKDDFTTMGLELNSGIRRQDEEGNYLFYYDAASHKEVKGISDIAMLPKDVVLLKIPHEYKLDPVAMARMDGFEDTAYLRQYPLNMYTVAQTIPRRDNLAVKRVEKTRIGNIKKNAPLKRGKRKGI